MEHPADSTELSLRVEDDSPSQHMGPLPAVLVPPPSPIGIVVASMSDLTAHDKTIHGCPVLAGCPYCDPDNATPENKAVAARIGPWKWGALADTFFTISLKERDDRMKHSSMQFHRVGLCTRMLFFRPNRPDLGLVKRLGIQHRAKFGLWESHRFVSWYAKTVLASSRNLVFEDDVSFLPKFSPAHLARMASHLNKNLATRRWDIYYLGHMPLYGNRPITKDMSLWRVHSTMLHAYVASAQFMRTISEMPFLDPDDVTNKERQLDYWTLVHARQYAYQPIMAVQAHLGSDHTPNSWQEKGVAIHAKHTTAIEFVFMYLVLLLLLAILVSIIVFASYRKRSTILPALGWTTATEPDATTLEAVSDNKEPLQAIRDVPRPEEAVFVA
jgi:hypothetical protein